MALLKVNQSAQVLFLKPSTDPDHPWVVLGYDPSMTTDKWAVWLVADAGFTSVAGGYYSTLKDAKADFDARGEGAPAISN